MRRVLLFAAFLVLFGLSTAMAASFDVQAEDITSFTTDVSISVPDLADKPDLLYLIVDYKLSKNFVGTAGVESEALKQNDFREWTTSAAEFPHGITIANKLIDLVVYLTGGGGQLTARLYNCPAPDAITVECDELKTASAILGNNQQTLPFYDPLAPVPFTIEIEPGHALRLRISNEASGSISIQWGKTNPLRDSRLVFSEPS